jgi:fatty-acyl-CoA synthase
MDSQDSGWRGKFAGFALGLSIFAVLWFAVAALGTKFGVWDYGFGLGKMMGNVTAGYGRFVIGAAALASITAIVVSLIAAPRKRALMLSLGALLIIALVGFRWMGFQLNALRLPPIHEAQTDWSMPIQPSQALLDVRTAAKASNAVEDAPTVPQAPGIEKNWPGTGGRLVSELQEEAEYDPARQKSPKDALYPAIAPLIEPAVSYDMAYNAVLETVKAHGWEIVTADIESGRIEATHTSGWFGFKDDILFRIAPEGDGSRIDIRSISRVGLSDLGMNARRVGGLLTEIDGRLK